MVAWEGNLPEIQVLTLSFGLATKLLVQFCAVIPFGSKHSIFHTTRKDKIVTKLLASQDLILTFG